MATSLTNPVEPLLPGGLGQNIVRIGGYTWGQPAPTSASSRASCAKYNGTGFFIGDDGLILTAYHVAARGADQMFAYIDDGLGQAVATVAVDPFHDLALLRLKDLFEGALPAPVGVCDMPVAVGTDVHVAGFPGSSPDALVIGGGQVIAGDGTSPLDGDDPVAFPSEVPDLRWEDTFLVDTEASGGQSGGPVYLQGSGRVVGVCVAVRGTVGNKTGRPVMAVPIRFGLELLRT